MVWRPSRSGHITAGPVTWAAIGPSIPGTAREKRVDDPLQFVE